MPKPHMVATPPVHNTLFLSISTSTCGRSCYYVVGEVVPSLPATDYIQHQSHWYHIFHWFCLKQLKPMHFNASRPSDPAIKLHQKVDVQLTWFLLVRSVQRFCSLWTGKLCLKTECWQGGWRHWNEASPIFLGHEILCHSPKHPAGRNDALWLKCFYSVPVLWSKRLLY